MLWGRRGTIALGIPAVRVSLVVRHSASELLRAWEDHEGEARRERIRKLDQQVEGN